MLNSMMSGAYYSPDLSEPNLNKPELWVYGERAGCSPATRGTRSICESGLDLHLKWRLSIVGGLQYVLPTHIRRYDLGGLGYRLRVAFNW